MNMWIASGTPEMTAHRNAELNVQRTLDGQGSHSVLMYLAAVRAYKSDRKTGFTAFQRACDAVANELYFAASNMPTWQQAIILSATIEGPNVPSAAPPAPAAAPSKVIGLKGTMPSSWMEESSRSADEIVLEHSSPATRILQQKWVRSLFTTWTRRVPPTVTSEDEWKRRLAVFARVVLQGQNRQPTEGSAMRWLTLKQPMDANVVISVSNNPGAYLDQLTGFHDLTHTPVPVAAILPSTTAPASRSKRYWVPTPAAAPTVPAEALSPVSTSSEGEAQETYIPLGGKQNGKSQSVKKRRVVVKAASPSSSSKVLKTKDVPRFTLGGPDEDIRRTDRARRFFAQDDLSYVSAQPMAGPLTWREKLALNSSTVKVVGESQALEKAYLRLCSAPDPSTVRPEHVLSQSFFHVFDKFLQKWDIESSGSSPSGAVQQKDVVGALSSGSYRYIEEQFRSIRQDYVVQRVVGDPMLLFVYATNARISQIFHDYGQFNQCHSQIKVHSKHFDHGPQEEFVCHQMIYAAVNSLQAEYSNLLRQAAHAKNNTSNGNHSSGNSPTGNSSAGSSPVEGVSVEGSPKEGGETLVQCDSIIFAKAIYDSLKAGNYERYLRLSHPQTITNTNTHTQTQRHKETPPTRNKSTHTSVHDDADCDTKDAILVRERITEIAQVKKSVEKWKAYWTNRNHTRKDSKSQREMDIRALHDALRIGMCEQSVCMNSKSVCMDSKSVCMKSKSVVMSQSLTLCRW